MLNVKKDDCLGCKSCYHVCPVSAISVENDRGFEYAYCDKTKCINCGRCLKVCPVINKCKKSEKVEFFAARNIKKQVLMESSSGGAFSALADATLKKSGVVYGVVIDEKGRVVYSRGDSKESYLAMRGSKYVSAYLSDEIFESMINDISGQKYVLVIGTPCQIHGLFLLFNEKKLDLSKTILVDFIVCSGGVSPVLWNEEYKRLLDYGKITKILFRDKRRGWRCYEFSVKYTNGKRKAYDSNLSPIGIFLGMNETKKESCAHCNYSSYEREADLSIGDYWKSSLFPFSWNDDKGVSVITVHSEKGRNAINDISEYLKISKNEKAKEKHFFDKASSKADSEKDKREKFWNCYERGGYEQILSKYCYVSPKAYFIYNFLRVILIKTRMITIKDYLVTEKRKNECD